MLQDVKNGCMHVREGKQEIPLSLVGFGLREGVLHGTTSLFRLEAKRGKACNHVQDFTSSNNSVPLDTEDGKQGGTLSLTAPCNTTQLGCQRLAY